MKYLKDNESQALVLKPRNIVQLGAPVDVNWGGKLGSGRIFRPGIAISGGSLLMFHWSALQKYVALSTTGEESVALFTKWNT